VAPSFAALLRRQREAAGLTQAELADRAGLGVRTVSNLERGVNSSPYPSTVRLLAEALELAPVELDALVAAARRRTEAPSRAPVGGYLGATPSTRLVGRDAEQAVVLAAVQDVASGHGRLVLLSGEPGIGKTRLAQEVSVRVQELGFRVATGRCYLEQSQTPFGPWLDAFDQLAPAPPPHLHRAVTAFVRDLAALQPVAVLLDDLHWADLASLELLSHLARHTPTDRVLLLGTYRDTEAGPAHPVRRLAHSLHREGRSRAVTVGRLDQEMTARLVTQQLDDPAPVSADLVDLVHRHCDGNPFFTVEMVSALSERGDLHRDAGEWMCRDDVLLEAPASVSEAIVERYVRLSPAAQDVLDAASVLGDVFDPEDLSTDEGALDEAVSTGLLTTVDGRYAFDHSLTRQSLYARLSPARRRRLHRELGDLLGGRPPAVRRRRAAEVARHLEASGDLARAVPFCLLAGDVAAEAHSPAEAIQLYERGLELAEEVDDVPSRAAGLERLARVLLTTARYDESVDALTRAADTFRALADVESRLRAEGLLAQAQHRRGESEAAARRLSAVVAELEVPIGGTEPAPGVAALCLGLARVRLSLGELPEALEATARATRLAREEQATTVEADAYAVSGTVRLFLDQPDQAVDDLGQAIRLARSVDAVSTESEATLALHWTLTMRGEFERALRLGERGLVLTRRSGDTDAEALHAADTGLTHLYAGDLAAAEQHLERGVELARSDSLTLFSGIAPAYLGLLRAVQGNPAAARACYDEAATAPDLTTFAFDAWIDARRAELDLAAGEAEAALERLAPWLEGEAPTRLHDVMIFNAGAETCLALGDTDRAAELVARALRRAEATRNVVDLARTRELAHRLPTDFPTNSVFGA